ncbi:MAG: hypothetical protein GQ532_01275 [Methylomarinum sp.]|nr:hypothetical protein [Methylomarinum sp.]
MLSIPSRLKELLEKDPRLNGFVSSSIANLSPWVEDNKTVFFPEYTDHGLKHLQEVLLSADSIISNESWPNLTPEDSAGMITAVLLHDCAMHLSEDGFYTLINDQFPEIQSRYVKKEIKWGLLWQEFMSEAKRFDGKKLKSFFNDKRPVKNIPDNTIDLTNRDKLLIGEFLRRHHARLAHEIAFNGVPGCDGKTIKLGDIDNKYLDLWGFIAKSHNMSLRSAVDKLELNKKRVHHNTHTPFIMLVLRIADYIQIHSERAPNQLLNVKALISPISQGEWKKHHSIVEIHQEHDDPEALFIDAEPEDALTFRSLCFLFKDIQKELDLSWSVLGEVYGRFTPLDKLGITIRRIRSTLDDLDEFLETKQPQYIPKVLKFQTADTEMMELMIAPLYGDKPEIGIRELMQNAVDACLELNDYVEKQAINFNKVSDEDVVITVVDKGNDGGEVIVEDYGIGMTLDIVENYFLNIGASFRKSDSWKKEHETDGHSDVYRTGRFGIGLLAAYLLGNKISVETRHVNEEQGLKFSCEKGSDSITVSHIDIHVGTKIVIEINKSVKNILVDKHYNWDWFALDTPKVKRKVVSRGLEKEMEQSRLVPNSSSSLGEEWYSIETTEYDNVFWSFLPVGYKSTYRRDFPSLICNGINVTDYLQLDDFEISKELSFIAVKVPSIVVFDQDGKFPISLQRNSLIGTSLSFKKPLTTALSYYIAIAIQSYCQKYSSTISESSVKYIKNISINGLTLDASLVRFGRFIMRFNGILPMDFDLLSIEKPNTLYMEIGECTEGTLNSDEFRKVCSNYVVNEQILQTKKKKADWISNFFQSRTGGKTSKQGISLLPIVGRRILMKKSEISSDSQMSRFCDGKQQAEWENDKWTMLTLDKAPVFEGDIEQLCKELDDSHSYGFYVYYLDWSKTKVKDKSDMSPFAKAWLDINDGQAVLTKKNKEPEK